MNLRLSVGGHSIDNNTNTQNDLRTPCFINWDIKDVHICLETISSIILYTTQDCALLRSKSDSKIAKKMNPRHQAQWS